MGEYENYILSAIFFILMCLIFYLWKRGSRKKSLNSRQQFIIETLELARSQFEIFNLKIFGDGSPKNGLSATLQEIDSAGLHMEAGGYVPESCGGGNTEVFFRAKRVEGPVFYAFSSRIKKVSKADYEDSLLLLEIPDSMRVEKKRHFIRVQPHKDDVRVIGVWQLKPGSKLPRATAELGAPLTHYKPGMTDEPVQVENISASGLALRVAKDNAEAEAACFQRGEHLLCLVIYVPDENDGKQIAFWCTGEIMNTRMTEGANPCLVIGLEFTNWAILEQGSSDIHWAHSSPSRGIKPIMQWVEQIDSKQARKPGL